MATRHSSHSRARPSGLPDRSSTALSRMWQGGNLLESGARGPTTRVGPAGPVSVERGQARLRPGRRAAGPAAALAEPGPGPGIRDSAPRRDGSESESRLSGHGGRAGRPPGFKNLNVGRTLAGGWPPPQALSGRHGWRPFKLGHSVGVGGRWARPAGWPFSRPRFVTEF